MAMMWPAAESGRAKDTKRLGELLMAERIITAAQFAEAAREQSETGGYIGQILVKKGFATDQAISEYLVRQLKIPRLCLLDYDINDKVLRQIPEDVCLRLRLMPIDRLGRILTVAMVDPLDKGALEEVQLLCPDVRIKPILCDWDHFEIVSKRLFGKAPKKPEYYAALRMKTSEKEGEKPSESAEAFQPEVADFLVPPESSNEAAGAPADAPQGGSYGLVRGVAPEPAFVPSAESVAMGDLALRIESSVQDSMRMVADEFRRVSADLRTNFEGVRPHRETAPPGGPSAEDVRNLARGIQEGVGEVMAEAMASLGAELRAISSQRAGGGEFRGTTPAELAEAMRQTLGPVLESSISNLGRELRDALSARQASLPEIPPPPDWGKITGAIRESVGSTVEEAMAAMAVQIKSVFVQKEAEGAEGQRHDITLLTEQLRETMAEAISDLREARQSPMAGVLPGLPETQRTQRADNTQQSQLAQIAEASMQSVRQTTELLERHIVSEGNRRDLHHGRRARHASVAPFGGGGAETPLTPEALEADSRLLDALDSETPLESLTFANFFPGTVNEFTHKVGQAVAAAPGGEYNPFFLYGHVGTGKTHLVSAIGNAILCGEGGGKARPSRVGYVSASHFARRLAEATIENAQDAFRENYCHWDALILDDIQFLGGRVDAQEEFFHIFNALYQQGRQIVIVADKAPDRLGLLEQRLVSRFASGIVGELKAPEWGTRMKILHHHVEQGGVPVPEEILSLIAMRVPSDVRKMTGALRKIAAFAKLVGKGITIEMAQEILSHLGVDEAA